MTTQFTDLGRFGWQMLSGSRNRHEIMIANLRAKDIQHHLQGLSTLQILDLANGQLRPQTLILKSMGYEIFGIDLINKHQSGIKEFGYKYARWLFSKQLGFTKSNNQGLNLTCGDVQKLPYVENCFDLISSVAAFEHFLDVPSVIQEMHKVLRTGGIIWVAIHLFSSLSGGHNVKLMEIPLRNLPRGIDAWDHLRKQRIPFQVPLNEWRVHQYLEEFSNHFNIINHYCAYREGENLLTPDIEAELSQYSRNELTYRTYVIVSQKV